MGTPKRCWGEGCLDHLAQPSATVARPRLISRKWMDICFCDCLYSFSFVKYRIVFQNIQIKKSYSLVKLFAGQHSVAVAISLDIISF